MKRYIVSKALSTGHCKILDTKWNEYVTIDGSMRESLIQAICDILNEDLEKCNQKKDIL